MHRRQFLALAAAVPNAIRPITADERRSRVEKARRLMRDHRITAILCEPGSSMFYFTGVRRTADDRLFGLVLPARGEAAWIIPEPEERRAPAAMPLKADVRTWRSGEDPFQKIAEALHDRGISTGQLGIEERTRFFVYEGIRKRAPALNFVSADAVTAGCRMIKSPSEIALMQRANDITIDSFRAALATMREGMTQFELRRNVLDAFHARGVEGDVMVSFGEYTAYPHGSIQPRKLREGDLVLLDDGCSVEGYQADVTRTTTFGKPTARQREIWNLERRAQDAALAAARPGATCESVDAAARKVITDFGFGPGYQVPGLPHRTGHGIGLDGHEWPYLVRGNKTRLEPRMCVSNEPTIAIYGEFGVRLEDCMYMTEDGARLFTKQSPSIEQPFG